jgi:TPR repeat protein
MDARSLQTELNPSELESFRDRWSEACLQFQQGRRSEALESFRKIAQEGYVEAFAEIGNIYEIGGGGVAKDVGQAIEWYQRSIEAMDDANAHLGLGRIYLAMDSERLNADLGIDHLLRAAEMNNPMAQSLLGLFYLLGKHVQKDLTQAESILKAAIQAGYVWPMLLMSAVEKQRGHRIKSFMYRIRAAIRSATLRTSDRRMWNVRNFVSGEAPT